MGTVGLGVGVCGWVETQAIIYRSILGAVLLFFLRGHISETRGKYL